MQMRWENVQGLTICKDEGGSHLCSPSGLLPSHRFGQCAYDLAKLPRMLRIVVLQVNASANRKKEASKPPSFGAFGGAQ